MSSVGLSEAVRAMQPGETIARALRVNVEPGADATLRAFTSNITSRLARLPGVYRTLALDGLDDGCTVAVRSVIITRVS